jgi:transcription-repair coupling factor (superfamily II helicase)
VVRSNKARIVAGVTMRKTFAAISSSSPLGMVALHLLAQSRKSGRNGVVFLAENETRAERLGAIIHALESSCNVLVFPRLNTLPFDQLEPSHEIAGRRSSVLRRLAKPEKPILLLSTAEAVMERLPMPANWSRTTLRLKVGGAFSEPDLRTRLEALGYDLDDEADYPGGALFHGQTFEIFPAGALGPFRIEHSGREIRRIVAVDPVEQNVLFETKELLLDPMSERLGFGSRRGQRATFFDYCKRAKWIADEGVPAHADIWLSTIEDAAGRADREREYLGRREWKQAAKRMKVLPQKAAFRATPDFSKITSPRKALRAFVDETRRACSRLVFVAAHEDDLRVMERTSGIKAQRFADWSEATAARIREIAFIADFDAGFVVPGQKPLIVVTASDVLGSRAHHPQPLARAWSTAFDHADVPEQGTVVIHLQRGLAMLDGLQTVAIGGRIVPRNGQARICGGRRRSRSTRRLGCDLALRSRAWQADARQSGRQYMVEPPLRGRAGDSNRRPSARQAYQSTSPPAGPETRTAGPELRKVCRSFPLFYDGRSGESHSGRAG